MENIEASTRQKILVLIDFSKSAYKALKYALSLAKQIDGEITLLYIAKTRDVVNSDNPNVVLRALDIATTKAETQLKSIAEMVEAEGVQVKYYNTVGDLPIKTNLHLELYKPNLVVIGKSNYGEHQLGELTEFLLYQFTGNLLIVGNEVEFNEGTNISVECNWEHLNHYNSAIINQLNKKTETALRVFVSKRKRSKDEFTFPVSWNGIAESSYKICNKNNQNFSLAKSIIGHIKEEKIGLICIGRKGKNKSIFANLFSQSNTTVDVINNARIPTLILGAAL